MRKLFLVFLLSLSFVCAAQTKDSTYIKHIAKNTIFIEGLGNGFYGSINYDRILKPNRFSLRIGAFYYPHYNNLKNAKFFDQFLSIPSELNVFCGRGNHKLEFGLGVTYLRIPLWYRDNTRKEHNVMENYFLLAGRILGYRYQRLGGGLFLRAGITLNYQIFESFSDYPNRYSVTKKFSPYGGIGIGYTF